jgi:cell wall-associated NlpC family hydrolase
MAVAMIVAVVLALLAGVVAVLTVIHTSHDSASASTDTRVIFNDQAPYVQPSAAPATAAVPTSVQAATTTVAKMGNWTQPRGIEIATRALHWYNWPYSFGGGNEYGPTYGVAVDFDSRNDGHIRGFDCSGLVMYAMAPWVKGLTHYAASQYSEVGHFHPSLSDLQPGDMLFWSKDGTVNGIGHVAIYIGGGRVVQAPESGAYIDVVPINQVEPGRIGVTRPLT